MFSKDFLFVWAPLYNAEDDQGGLLIYENSHKHGYWKHKVDNKIGSTNINQEKLKKFKKKNITSESGISITDTFCGSARFSKNKKKKIR